MFPWLPLPQPEPQLFLFHILFAPGAAAPFDLVADKPERQSQRHTEDDTYMGAILSTTGRFGDKKKDVSDG